MNRKVGFGFLKISFLLVITYKGLVRNWDSATGVKIMVMGRFTSLVIVLVLSLQKKGLVPILKKLPLVLFCFAP